MSAVAEAAVRSAPDWFLAEMPRGYQTRVAEIQRLSADLHGMDRIGRLLWEIGLPLKEAVRDVFVALKFEAELTSGATAPEVTVKLDAKRRLLLYVSETEGTIQKKGAEVAHTFQMLHEFARDEDRVVLVANSDRVTQPSDRGQSITPDALSFLSRMGVNFLTTPTLFKLWTGSLQDQNRARTYIEQLYAQDGGTFLLPPS